MECVACSASLIPEEFLEDETFSGTLLAEVAEKLIGALLFSQSPASVIRPFSRTGMAVVSASLLTEVKVTVEY